MMNDYAAIANDKLPSDEEIVKYVEHELGWPVDGTAESNGMIKIAKWMRDKIQNGQ